MDKIDENDIASQENQLEEVSSFQLMKVLAKRGNAFAKEPIGKYIIKLVIFIISGIVTGLLAFRVAFGEVKSELPVESSTQ